MDDRLDRFLELLRADQQSSFGTSIRLPAELREAASLAAELGLATSTTELTVRGLRNELELIAQRAVLDAHYEEHPEARPDLSEIALMAARLEEHPIAGRPDLIERAAREIVTIVEHAGPDEVLAYAAGLASAAA